MNCDVEALRRWFDDIEFGPTSSTNPFQCALVTNSILPSRDRVNIITSTLETLCSRVEQDTVEEITIDVEDIASKVLYNLCDDIPPTPNVTVQDSLHFIADIELLSNLSTSSQPVSIPSHRNSLPPTSTTHNISAEPPSASVPKRNPFMTAKEKFGAEGGDLTAIQKQAPSPSMKRPKTDELPASLQHLDPAIVAKIESDILQSGQPITFDDIAGLEFAKKCVQELICWPMLRPDLFVGLRSLPKGVLLFGPPGTGKTLIGKAIACQTNATFFSISASSLTSKWVGEGEGAVKALFALAAYRQPSVIFIDEVDSLLTQRSSEENEASRRLKTEFLIQIDGASTKQDVQVIVIGATNRPDELDEAARRRFVKRLYIPLPDAHGRKQLLLGLLSKCSHALTDIDISAIVDQTSGYSGADMHSLCTEAAMAPVRAMAMRNMDLKSIRAEDVPPVDRSHFDEALHVVSTSVSSSDLQKYVDWNSQYGTYKRIE